MIVEKTMNRNMELRKIEKLVISLASILIIVGVAAYCLSPAIDSDMVEGIFWAEEASVGNGIFSKDFIYSYRIPFGANILLRPFIRFWGMTQLANSLGMLFFFLCMVIVTFLFYGELYDRKELRFLATAITILAFRTQMGTNLLHHILHYQLGFICFLGAMCSILHILFYDGDVERRWYVSAFIFAMWSGANGLPTIMLGILPVVFALVMSFLFEKALSRTVRELVIFMLVGILGGYGVYLCVIHGIRESTYLNDVGAYFFAPADVWINNLSELIRAWIGFFLVTDPEQKAIISIDGVETIVSIFAAISTAAIPIYMRCRPKKMSSKIRFVFWGGVFIWIVCLFQYIFIRKNPEPRILYSGLFINYILLAIWICEHIPQTNKEKFIRAIFLLVLFFYSISFSAKANWSFKSLNIEPLVERGLDYGISASFWDAGITTVDTGGQIKIRPVDCIGGTIKPWEYQTNVAWYERPLDEEKWFLLMREEAFQELQKATNRVLMESCLETVEIEGSCVDNQQTTRHEYNKLIDDQKYVALIFPIEKWDECVFGRKFCYNFEYDEWISKCEYRDNELHILDGGCSCGPYIKMEEGEWCRVTIDGKNLNYIDIQAYNMQNDGNIPLEIEYETQEDNLIDFIIVASMPIESLEIVLGNPEDEHQGDIVLCSEVVEIIR